MRIRMKSFLLMFCLFAAIAANAKEEPIQLFPRTYGYFSRGDSETQTITLTMLTDSTAGKTQKMWIFPFIIILF